MKLLGAGFHQCGLRAILGLFQQGEIGHFTSAKFSPQVNNVLCRCSQPHRCWCSSPLRRRRIGAPGAPEGHWRMPPARCVTVTSLLVYTWCSRRSAWRTRDHIVFIRKTQMRKVARSSRSSPATPRLPSSVSSWSRVSGYVNAVSKGRHRSPSCQLDAPRYPVLVSSEDLRPVRPHRVGRRLGAGQ
jgi:hypothetical protein